MTKNLRDQRKDMEQIAKSFGVPLEWEPTRGNHLRAVFKCPTQAVAVTMAKGHGGDPRARLNNIRTARRGIEGALRVHA